MTYFLLRYDLPTRRARVTSIEDEETAVAELRRAEESRKPDEEVVLLYGRSLDALRRTHSRYFKDVKELLLQVGEDLAPVP